MRWVLFLFCVATFTNPLAPNSTSGQATAQTNDRQNNQATEAAAADRIKQATQRINNQQTYQLEYRLKQGQQIRWQVEHIASTRTQMAGESEETSSRSKSMKLWEVRSVDSRGAMTFDHKIESVDMWQKIGDTDPVAYNSQQDKQAPLEFESLAEKLGSVLATISINPGGQVTDRKSPTKKGSNFGVGDVTIPLPTKPIAVGYQWSVPDVLRAKDADGNPQQLKSRVVYKLIKVKSNNAYISFKTEVLTPVESEKIRSQIMQQMTKGYLVFDIDRGYPVRKEVEWDEKVQGFEGPDSLLEYLGRMTERLVTDSPASKKQTANSKSLKPLR